MNDPTWFWWVVVGVVLLFFVVLCRSYSRPKDPRERNGVVV